MGSDPQQAPIHFVFESLPESGPLGLVMADGSQKLELRFLEAWRSVILTGRGVPAPGASLSRRKSQPPCHHRRL